MTAEASTASPFLSQEALLDIGEPSGHPPDSDACTLFRLPFGVISPVEF